MFILTWQELVPVVDLFKCGENFNPAFIFGNDYRYLLYICLFREGAINMSRGGVPIIILNSDRSTGSP